MIERLIISGNNRNAMKRKNNSIPAPGTNRIQAQQRKGWIQNKENSFASAFASANFFTADFLGKNSMNINQFNDINNFTHLTRLVIPKDKNDRWYIVFYAWDSEKNCKIRKRDYDVNQVAIHERESFAKNRIEYINQLLKSGAVVAEEATRLEKVRLRSKTVSFKDSILEGLEYRKPRLSIRSYKSVRLALNPFFKFVEENYRMPYIYDFRHVHGMHYMDWLVDSGISNKSTNNYISYIRTIFDELVRREIVLDNPFANVLALPTVVTNKNMSYNAEQVKELMPLIKKDQDLYDFVQWIYYSSSRPSELMRLRIKQIQVQFKSLFIPAKDTKVRIDLHKSLHSVLIDIYKRRTKDVKDVNSFLFGKLGKTSIEPIRENTMAERMRAILDRLKYPPEYTLYSWKHTGIVDAYRNGADIKSIQKMCGHKSLDMTDRYLKSLGLYTDFSLENFITKI